MLTNPKIGQLAQVWYRESLRGYAQYHGKIGHIITPSKGKPRNHLVWVSGQDVVIPCGNLRKPKYAKL